jgi:hypothetical protein
MSELKDFKAVTDSDARSTPMRVAFITRRTSPAVKTAAEAEVMTHPETFLRIAVAIELLVIALIGFSLVWNAPLEQLADPLHTPNPAKAPWYFLGLQELLHYFPPVVAGVLIPGLVIIGLMAIPYCNASIHAEGHWLRDRVRRTRILGVMAALCVSLAAFQAYPALAPTLVIGGFMLLAARRAEAPASGFERWLVSKPLSFWIMTWFLVQLVVLTAIGTYFRGPGWSWVWPWRS